jgi:hypothetical protein
MRVEIRKMSERVKGPFTKEELFKRYQPEAIRFTTSRILEGSNKREEVGVVAEVLKNEVGQIVYVMSGSAHRIDEKC